MALIVIVLALNLTFGHWLRTLEIRILPDDLQALHRTLIVTCVIYALILALPFVPGVEIGIALLTMMGPAAAPYVYAATLIGLCLSYGAGRLVPLQLLATGALRLRMRRSAALLARLAPLDGQQRLEMVLERAPNRLLPTLIRFRYLALALVLNLPGNAVLGGGGGIALVAGMSRLFSGPGFVLTVAIAVSPVPVLIGIFGIDPFAP